MADTLQRANWTVIDMLGEEFVRLLRQYYYVGGMPAAVLAFAEQRGLKEVRNIQNQILRDYRRDFRNMHQRMRCHALIWCGIVFLLS